MMPVEEWRGVIDDCLAAVVDAHETVSDAALDWADDAPMTPLHELDDAEQLLADVVAGLRRAQRAERATS